MLVGAVKVDVNQLENKGRAKTPLLSRGGVARSAGVVLVKFHQIS